MGNCVYCGKKAGLFKSIHSECEKKHAQGIAEIKKLPLLYSIDEPFAQTIEASKQIAADCFIDDLARLRALINGISTLAEKYLDDDVITVEKEKIMDAIVTSINYDFSAVIRKIQKGVVLRNLAEGIMPNVKLDRCHIDLEKNETIVYAFGGVAVYEMSKANQHKGENHVFLRGAKKGYQGPSVFMGYPVVDKALVPKDVGILFVTDKNIYFYSEAMLEKIPLNRIAVTTNYNDGIGIQKDGEAAKHFIFKMVVHPDDGWFVCNIVHYLLEAVDGTQGNELRSLEEKTSPIRTPIQKGSEIAAISETVNPARIPEIIVNDFRAHGDIRSLLWFGDGPMKNLSEEQRASGRDVYSLFEGKIKMTVQHSLSMDEPSLIFTEMPVNEPEHKSFVPAPPYFPKYKTLTPEQKWVYMDFLVNPYNACANTGYVFILYYGLERHLLHGDFHSAFNVILKLRKVHKNKSFQSYSGNALILAASYKNKGEYIQQFVNALDNEDEFNFSDNLLLISYYSFDIPLSSKDLMRMAKTFGFTNTNYIKKNPDMFEECLSNIIKEKTGAETISLKNCLTGDELQYLKYADIPMFANGSIMGSTVPVPLFADSVALKNEMNVLLETAHAKVKKRLAEMRKNGTLEQPQTTEKPIEPKARKTSIDPRLLEEPSVDATFLEKHYHYSDQIRPLYARRGENEAYLDMAIEACKKAISISASVIEELKVKNYEASRMPLHLGYQQLCIILDKQGNYEEIISLAEKAKAEGWNGDWDKRIEKARKKLGE